MNKEEKAVSWNVGPHGYKGSTEEIDKIFEQGPPIICLQDVRIPKRRKSFVKRELQLVFPHYWIYITTAHSLRKDCRDRPYFSSVLTALHLAFFPKVTQIRCPHSRQMKPDTRREIDSRLSITQAQTPTGTTFQLMNIYQFTASNPMGQTDMWTTTENWITKQKNNRVMMQGDLNFAHPGCQWDYAQTLKRDLGMADNTLEHFLNSTGGHSYAQQEHTWTGKGCQTALDHVITWNYHLPPSTAQPNPKSHQKFDRNQIWTQLPQLDFPRLANTARTTPPDFSQQIDTVFFKRHVDNWKARIKTQIQEDLDENLTGQALADLIHKEQKILAKEVRWLQDKAWRARKRAGERKEHRNKTQNTLLKSISLLKAALTETTPLQPKDKIKGATRKAMQGLGFLYLRPTFQKLVRQHDRWKALLTLEIDKAEKLMDNENLKQSRRDDRRDIRRKKEIFKHGVKGIKKITGKYNTSKPLTEVKISCPYGLKWTWQEHASSLTEQEREALTMTWIKECTKDLTRPRARLPYST